jgi:hypothetical protein
MHITIRRDRMATRGRAASRNAVYVTITDTGVPDPVMAIGPHHVGQPITEWVRTP